MVVTHFLTFSPELLYEPVDLKQAFSLTSKVMTKLIYSGNWRKLYQEFIFENILIISTTAFSQMLLKVEKPTQEPFPYHTLVTKVEKYIKSIELIILIVLIVKKCVTKVWNSDYLHTTYLTTSTPPINFQSHQNRSS